MARGRTYTDDELVRAVEESRSWRGVLRSLGLTATSASAMRSVRRQADSLGVDYGHFTGQRRWSDAELATAVAGSSSWGQVVKALGLADESSQVTLRGHAARLGIDVSHLRSPERRDPVASAAMTPDPTNLPRAGSLIAAAWFALCGYQVSWPLEPARYDLLVQRGLELQRVQVKTASVRAGDSWQVWISTTGGRRTTYDPEEIDLFFVIDGDFTFYAIPVEVVGGMHAVTLSTCAAYVVRQGARPCP